jgi:hypothetical protein
MKFLRIFGVLFALFLAYLQAQEPSKAARNSAAVKEARIAAKSTTATAAVADSKLGAKVLLYSQALTARSIDDLVNLHKQPEQPKQPCNSCHSVSPTGSGGAATQPLGPDPAVVSKTLLDAIVSLCPSVQPRLPAREGGKSGWSLVELRAGILKELSAPEARAACASR